jgi:hypothetical protein
MDTNKIIFNLFYNEGLFIQINFIIPTNYTFHFSKNSFAIYDEVKFQNMMNIFILVAYPTKLQDFKLAPSKQKQHAQNPKQSNLQRD